MNITQNGSAADFTITGKIKTIDDSIALRETVHTFVEAGVSSIILRIPDSPEMPSAVIGYLMKLANREKIHLTVIASDLRLRELLDELHLTEIFDVRER